MKQHSSRFLNLVQQAKANIRELSVHDIKSMQGNHEAFFLIDVREQDEWIRGHLPHAVYLGKGIIERDIEKLIPDEDAKLVLYCGGGYRSALATDALQRMGYKNVYSMDGGFSGWSQAGYEIVV